MAARPDVSAAAVASDLSELDSSDRSKNGAEGFSREDMFLVPVGLWQTDGSTNHLPRIFWQRLMSP